MPSHMNTVYSQCQTFLLSVSVPWKKKIIIVLKPLPAFNRIYTRNERREFGILRARAVLAIFYNLHLKLVIHMYG